MAKVLREIWVKKGSLFCLVDGEGNRLLQEADEPFIVRELLELEESGVKSEVEKDAEDLAVEESKVAVERNAEFEEDVHERRLSKEDFEKVSGRKVKGVPFGFKRESK